METNIKEKEKRREEFIALCRPIIKFLNDNYHPHAQVTITTNTYELMEGLIGGQCNDFIKD